MRDLMLRFASLGDNCEFGVAQQHYDANPMDLLRWAATPTGVLVRLLRNDFKGIGDNLKIVEHGRAFQVTSPTYGFNWHDWTPAAKASVELIAAREERRLPAMAAKLRKELRDGSRIFVFKQSLQPMSQVFAERVHDAMNTFGKPVLVYVLQGAPVSVTEVRPRLLRGTIPAFADPGRVPPTTRSADWLELCQAVAAWVDEHYRDADQDGASGVDSPSDGLREITDA